MRSNRIPKSIVATQPIWLGLWALLALFLSTLAQALESDAQQPIQIEAQQAEFNPETGIAVYTGNVLIQQGSLRIAAEQVTVYQDDQKAVKKVVATAIQSLVHLQQQPRSNEPLVQAYAQLIEYHAVTQEVLLQNDALLENGQDQFRGNQIRYHLQTRHIKAWGTDTKAAEQTDTPQVKIILYPKTDIEPQSKAQ